MCNFPFVFYHKKYLKQYTIFQKLSLFLAVLLVCSRHLPLNYQYKQDRLPRIRLNFKCLTTRTWSPSSRWFVFIAMEYSYKVVSEWRDLVLFWGTILDPVYAIISQIFSIWNQFCYSDVFPVMRLPSQMFFRFVCNKITNKPPG